MQDRVYPFEKPGKPKDQDDLGQMFEMKLIPRDVAKLHNTSSALPFNIASAPNSPANQKLLEASEITKIAYERQHAVRPEKKG